MNKGYCIAIIVACMTLGCAAPGFLPTRSEIDVNEFGSYIRVAQKHQPTVTGELISVDTTEIIVLSKQQDKIIPLRIPRASITWYSIRYANAESGWLVLLPLSSIAHGYYGVFTFPINSIVAGASATPYDYSKKTLPYTKLNMFARFPQGLPPGVDLASLKYSTQRFNLNKRDE